MTGIPPRPRAVIGGGSGYLGRAIRDALRIDGFDVRTIGRADADARWDDPDAILRLVDGAALVIGLAGRRIDCRYTDRNREEILRSRVETTRALHRAIGAAQRPPAVWMNGSSAGAYRYALERRRPSRIRRTTEASCPMSRANGRRSCSPETSRGHAGSRCARRSCSAAAPRS